MWHDLEKKKAAVMPRGELFGLKARAAILFPRLIFVQKEREGNAGFATQIPVQRLARLSRLRKYIYGGLCVCNI